MVDSRAVPRRTPTATAYVRHMASSSPQPLCFAGIVPASRSDDRHRVVRSVQKGWSSVQTHRQHGSDIDDALCGLSVYSSEFVPLGRVAEVMTSASPDVDTIAGRLVTVDPNPTLRYVLDGADLVVSESMIYQAAPAEDRVILNLPARQVVRMSRHQRR